MKVDLKIAGAQYKDVPALIAYFPTGTVHRFYDVSDTTAEAADVARGKFSTTHPERYRPEPTTIQITTMKNSKEGP